MKEKLIPLTTMLTAGAVTGILCIWKRYDTLYSLEVLLGVLIGFYLIGLFARKLIRKVCAEPVLQEEDEDTLQTEEQPGDAEHESVQARQER